MDSIRASRIEPVKSKYRMERDSGGLYEPKDARKLSMRELTLHLCSAGPTQCWACGLCAYGREYERRTAGTMRNL